MSFEEMIRKKISEAPFKSLEKNLFKLVLGEVQQKGSVTEEQGLLIVKKILKGNQETLELMPQNDERRPQIEAENRILNDLLPSYLSDAEILEKIGELSLTDAIKSAKSSGQAVGVVMSNFKKNSLVANGENVKQIVENLRN